MTLKIFIPLFTIFCCCNAYGASDSTYNLIIGKSKQPLKFHSRLDSTTVFVSEIKNASDELIKDLREKPYAGQHIFVIGDIDTFTRLDPTTLEVAVLIMKDTIIPRTYLREKSNDKNMSVYVGKTFHHDTIMSINPLNLDERQVIIPYRRVWINNDLGDMDYNSFFKQVKSGFVIENSKETLHVSLVGLWYGTADTSEWITLKYPNPDSRLIEKLSALQKGGFVILTNMVTQGESITETIKLSTYFTINNPSARPNRFDKASLVSESWVEKPVKDSVIFFSCTPLIGNVLYWGIDNPITISVSGISASNIKATAEGNVTVTQKRNEPNIFIVNANYLGKCTIRFKGIVNGNYVEIGSQTFTIKRIPMPTVTVNGAFGSASIPAESFQEFTGLIPKVLDFDWVVRYNVIDFDMLYFTKGKILRSHATGPLFNQEMLHWFNIPEKDDLFYITNIKVVGPDAQRYNLPPISLMVLY